MYTSPATPPKERKTTKTQLAQPPANARTTKNSRRAAALVSLLARNDSLTAENAALRAALESYLTAYNSLTLNPHNFAEVARAALANAN